MNLIKIILYAPIWLTMMVAISHPEAVGEWAARVAISYFTTLMGAM